MRTMKEIKAYFKNEITGIEQQREGASIQEDIELLKREGVMLDIADFLGISQKQIIAWKDEARKG